MQRCFQILCCEPYLIAREAPEPHALLLGPAPPLPLVAAAKRIIRAGVERIGLAVLAELQDWPPYAPGLAAPEPTPQVDVPWACPHWVPYPAGTAAGVATEATHWPFFLTV